MKRFSLSLSLLLIAAALLAACGTPPVSGADVTAPTEAPIVSHGPKATDYASLLEALKAAGATLTLNGEIEQPFFSVKGQVITVNGQDVQVFEYASIEEAEAQAALVALNGSSVGTSMMAWMAMPNFFKAGRLIVLYVGDDALTLDHLMQVLGVQFAGGPFVEQAPTSSDGGVTMGGSMRLPAANAAVQALAAERGLATDTITVLSAEPVEWPDACLGVAKADQMCAQVITPGYIVVLQVGDEQVTYHTDELGMSLVLVP